ncbi:MAG: ADP-ribosylglycohydrolase family protein [Acidobacteria bacterium]|nr:ADP-ribosylglycohydrolase family protein [Acidobacteriota bacterium]
MSTSSRIRWHRPVTALIPLVAALLGAPACAPPESAPPPADNRVTLSTETLRDKIKGAWAAQTIGVTYGYPVEFRFNSERVPDERELPWYDGYLLETFTQRPGVYDDIYMDLTFVQVLEDEGLDAPAQSFADAFANADYSLWFANQVARYNVLNGLRPPESGHWLNNPAADDIDFQIEADFAGIMSPGLVNSAVDISDRVGHIMNYGDGWYGGVFIASMYALAFLQDDIETIVREALDVIPAESDFHQVVADVLALHDENPDDWTYAWDGIHEKWADTDLGPSGLMAPFNIDAKINAAWVVLGLLYGDGDFSRTLEIATRAGDDADCNPSSAAGILGAIYGYEAIPDFWKQGLAAVEGLDFAYTTISLNDAYELSYQHALETVRRAGGEVADDTVTIPVQAPQLVPFEDAFENHVALERRPLRAAGSDEDQPVLLSDSYAFEFDGVGFALMGDATTDGEDHVFTAELYVDGELVETAEWPTAFTTRRFYLFWKYALPDGTHQAEVRLVNPVDHARVTLEAVVVYAAAPA